MSIKQKDVQLILRVCIAFGTFYFALYLLLIFDVITLDQRFDILFDLVNYTNWPIFIGSYILFTVIGAILLVSIRSTKSKLGEIILEFKVKPSKFKWLITIIILFQFAISGLIFLKRPAIYFLAYLTTLVVVIMLVKEFLLEDYGIAKNGIRYELNNYPWENIVSYRFIEDEDLTLELNVTGKIIFWVDEYPVVIKIVEGNKEKIEKLLEEGLSRPK